MSYGAPSPVAVDAVLASGYTLPSATAVDGVLSRVGPYYGAPLPTEVDVILAAGYTPPSATAVNVVLAYTSTLYPDGIDDGAFGTAELSLRTITPLGIAPGSFGTPELLSRAISPNGLDSSTYGVPTLVLRNQSFALTGWQSSSIGTANVYLRTRYLSPNGWQSSSFGTPTTYLLTQYVTTFSWISSGIGTPTLTLRNRYLEVGGIAPPPLTGVDGDRQMPTPSIGYRTRVVVPAGMAEASFPTHYIAHYYQFIDLAGRGSDAITFGAHQIADRIRYIEPPFIASNVFGTAIVARNQVVYVGGWESSVVSVGHQLDINLQRLQHHSVGTDPAGYGATQVRNRFEILRPTGIPEGGVNFHVVFNRKQQIQVGAYENTTGDPTTWPRYYPFVENRNRTVRPSGWTSSRFSALGHGAFNTAVPITPDGLDATLWGAADVGHRIRYIPVASIDESYLSSYTQIYNSAKVIASVNVGNVATFGVAEFVNRNRSYTVPTLGSTLAFGDAFTAYRIRSVSVYQSYDPPYVPLPEVRRNPYPISPPSLPEQRSSAHTVYERFNRFFPSSANVASVPRIGEPSIENRNKTLRVFPSDQLEVGRARVENYIRYLTDVSAGQQVSWGRTDISRRTKTLAAAPISTPVFTVLHRIRNVIPDPPVRQVILVDGVYIGSPMSPGIVSFPTFFPYYVRPNSISPSGFGTPVLTTNQIRTPRGIFTLDQVGVPFISGTQYCSPISFLESDSQWGAIRLSPHTIYAPSSDQATPQAQDNHPANSPHRIGELDAPIPGWPLFGEPTVANKNRTIGPVPLHRIEENEVVPALHTRYGTADFQLYHRRVLAAGVRPGRFGFASILGGQQSVDLNDPSVGIASPSLPTGHEVAPPYGSSRNARPVGLVPGALGVARIDLFNRVIAPEGIRHRGNPEQGLTSPWGQALIGPPVPIPVGGYIMTLWGTARVEHRIRSVYALGFESLSLSDYTLSGFSDRMRVSRRNPPGGIVGIAPGALGIASIDFAVRTVGANSVRGFASGTPSVSMVIHPSGWNGTVFGDIDRWEAGKIKPYGPDMSSLGTPRMVHTLRPSGEDTSVLSSPRMARAVIIAGMPPVGFDGPYITDMTGCNNRVVVVLPIAAPSLLPPVVGHV